MHFALPPRKGAASPPYARAAARISATRRTKRFQLAGYCLLGSLTIWLVLRYTLLGGSSSLSLLDDNVETNIVIVTVLDDDAETMSPEYVRKIKANRDDYASRHGTYQDLPRMTISDFLYCRVHQLLCQRLHL
jgi:mannan polymerase II complex MNN11 subunit